MVPECMPLPYLEESASAWYLFLRCKHACCTEFGYARAAGWGFIVNALYNNAWGSVDVVMNSAPVCFAELEGAPKALLTEVIRLLEAQGKAQ